MVRLAFSVELNYQVLDPGADFILNLQAARTRHQRVVRENLAISQPVLMRSHTDAVTHTRTLRFTAQPGPLRVLSEATVDIAHHLLPPDQVGETRVAELPDAAWPYLYPSRYCESDRLHQFAVRQFGGLWQGHGRVAAIRDWVQQYVNFRSNTSTSVTSACDTLVSGQGVCRDFAHLMIALCRAVNIPARFATGFDYGADPALGPPDFHAYVEAFLGQRWYLFDPSGTAIPTGLLRLATSRDAADAAFATIFGAVQSQPPIVSIAAVANDQGHIILPTRVNEALSTDSGEQA